MHVGGEAVGGFVVVVDAHIGLGGVGAVEAAGVLDDAAGEGDGRGEKKRVEAREIEALAKKRGGGEKGERGRGGAGGGVGEAREVGENGGAFAA